MTQDSAIFLGLNKNICGIDHLTLCTDGQLFFSSLDKSQIMLEDHQV